MLATPLSDVKWRPSGQEPGVRSHEFTLKAITLTGRPGKESDSSDLELGHQFPTGKAHQARSLTAERQVDNAPLEMSIVVRLLDDLELFATVF
jgi:hypothetical protein